MHKNDYLFMQPLWRRIVLLLVCLGWAAMEWWGGAHFWGSLAIAVTGYVVWRYFLRFEPPADLDG